MEGKVRADTRKGLKGKRYRKVMPNMERLSRSELLSIELKENKRRSMVRKIIIPSRFRFVPYECIVTIALHAARSQTLLRYDDEAAMKATTGSNHVTTGPRYEALTCLLSHDVTLSDGES